MGSTTELHPHPPKVYSILFLKPVSGGQYNWRYSMEDFTFFIPFDFRGMTFFPTSWKFLENSLQGSSSDWVGVEQGHFSPSGPEKTSRDLKYAFTKWWLSMRGYWEDYQESPDESCIIPNNAHWNWLSKGRVIKHTTFDLTLIAMLVQFPRVSGREAYNFPLYCQSYWKKQEAGACGVWRLERQNSARQEHLFFVVLKREFAQSEKWVLEGAMQSREKGRFMLASQRLRTGQVPKLAVCHEEMEYTWKDMGRPVTLTHMSKMNLNSFQSVQMLDFSVQLFSHSQAGASISFLDIYICPWNHKIWDEKVP